MIGLMCKLNHQNVHVGEFMDRLITLSHNMLTHILVTHILVTYILDIGLRVFFLGRGRWDSSLAEQT